MNIEAMRIFREVARQKSFSRAAAILDVTQSAASQAIQHLERDLSVQLLDRSHRPPRLTPPGETFFAACCDILERLDLAITEMRALENEVAGTVTVASIYSAGLYHTDEIRQFMNVYPKASVRLNYMRPNLVASAVLNGNAALGLISFAKETKELAVIPWKEEKMLLVCHPQHRLAARLTVRLEDLAGEPFVAFDADLAIRKKIDAALHRHKVDVDVVMELDNIETIKQAVQIKTGVSILPEPTVRQMVESGALAAVPFATDVLVRPVGIIHRKGRPLSLAATKFIALLTGQLPKQEPPVERTPIAGEAANWPQNVQGGEQKQKTVV